MKISVLFLLLFASINSVSAAGSDTAAMPAAADYGERLAIPAVADDSEIVRHEGYSLLYSENDEQAFWVAYLLTREETEGLEKRSGSFKADPEIGTGSARLSDYKGSGYDRGHLAPAADLKYSKQAMNDSFYLSNMSPQKPSFNRGIWKKLEKWVRKRAAENETLCIVTGPLLTDGPYSTIGEERLSIPKYFYKVILDFTGEEKKAIGFILPNEKSDGPLSDFAVTVDRVETVTGIDFFPLLDDGVEKALESNADFNIWITETE